MLLKGLKDFSLQLFVLLGFHYVKCNFLSSSIFSYCLGLLIYEGFWHADCIPWTMHLLVLRKALSYKLHNHSCIHLSLNALVFFYSSVVHNLDHCRKEIQNHRLCLSVCSNKRILDRVGSNYIKVSNKKCNFCPTAR